MLGSRFTPIDGSPWRDVAAVAAVLFVGSALPAPFGRHPEFARFGPDKLLHLLGHGGFAAVVADSLGSGRLDPRSACTLAACLSTGYALLLGRLQEWIPGREPERADLAASTVGSVLGAVWWYLSVEPSPPEA
ncbi:teicoplanin resistance protein VanZ [Salinirubellus sp. GCM10025818]|uniref:VanZ family protein n=1 Tax=Salinirubellus TaxID=2162630 RepID=UPI0030D0C007